MRHLTLKILALAALFLTVMAGSGCTQAARRARHLARANQYFDSAELDKAEIEYLIVLKTDQANPQAIGRLGIIYYEQGRYGRAIPFLVKGKGSRRKTWNCDGSWLLFICQRARQSLHGMRPFSFSTEIRGMMRRRCYWLRRPQPQTLWPRRRRD